MCLLRHLSFSLRIVRPGGPAAGWPRSLTTCHAPSRDDDDEASGSASLLSTTSSTTSSTTPLPNGPLHHPSTVLVETTTPPRPSHFVDVSPLAATIRQQVRDYSNQQRSKPIQLVGILANRPEQSVDDSELYSERIAKTCTEDGIGYDVWRCPPVTTPEEIGHTIRHANENPQVDGILVFYPVFTNTRQKGPYKNRLQGVYYKTYDCHFRDLVALDKDVEGLRGTKWYHNHRRHKTPQTGQHHQQQQQLVYPCTARSVEAILEHYHFSGGKNETAVTTSHWRGQTVSIVNRSEIVGRPLAAMLAAKGATVYSIDESSTVIKFWPRGERLQRCQMTLQECLSESTILVTGVPHEDFQIPTSCIPLHTTVVNVSEFPNVCENELVNRTDITYIPQVGKVTVAILEENLVLLHRQRNKC